ncbi:MAG: hypothetical protein WAV41_04365 [Microgenomates group bacterium]
MTNIVLVLLASATFLVQIAYSIYYSIKVVDLSSLVNSTQQQINTDQITLQREKTLYLSRNSLPFIIDQIKAKHYLPLSHKIDIK